MKTLHHKHDYIPKGVRSSQDVAKELDISPTRVSQILTKAFRKLASETLKGMGLPQTPEAIDRLAFDETFIELVLKEMEEK